MQRRLFLAALASAASACRTLGGSGSTAPGVAPAPGAPAPCTVASGEITVETIAEAEKLAGVSFSPAERAQMLALVDEHLERITARRRVSLSDELMPATLFEPRLPGAAVPAVTERALRYSTPRPRTWDGPQATAFASVAMLGHGLRTGAITSTALTELSLKRLERYGDEPLQCVVTSLRERALEQAARADAELAAGKDRGPLHGIPWGVKDLFDTAGEPTTWGAAPFAGRVPADDAEVVRRLDEAGAVLVAKLTTGALAYGDIWYGGRTRNPWNLDEGSMGSSAGPAAAVAAGLVGFAVGTETMGSIIAPSMRCGTTGLRPTFGRIPRSGCMPLCWSLDKVGPVTRTVEDALMVLDALRGTDGVDPCARDAGLRYDAQQSIEELRIGFVDAWFSASDAPAEDRAALDLLRRRGAKLVDVSLPEAPHDALLAILFAESATAFEELTLRGGDDALTWQGDEAWPNTFRLSRFITAIDYLAAQRLRRKVMRDVHAMFENVDVVVGPSFDNPFLLVTNMTGHPCITLRTSFVKRRARPELDEPDAKPEGALRRVPHGICVWGRLFEEGTICRVARCLEDAFGVWSRPPAAFSA